MRRACEALVFVLFVHSTAAAPSPRQDTLVVNEENGPRNDTAALGQPLPDETWNELFSSNSSNSSTAESSDPFSSYLDDIIGELFGGDYGEYTDDAPVPSPPVAPPVIAPAPPVVAPASPAKPRRLSASIANRIMSFYETAAPEERTFSRRVVKELNDHLNPAEPEKTMSIARW
ncbi:hypothetical protein AAVH_13163 [Aphelenchoides avenae]|nr:hypothetical protein AAVH_13163 [Aphelenchus avenae]